MDLRSTIQTITALESLKSSESRTSILATGGNQHAFTAVFESQLVRAKKGTAISESRPPGPSRSASQKQAYQASHSLVPPPFDVVFQRRNPRFHHLFLSTRGGSSASFE